MFANFNLCICAYYSYCDGESTCENKYMNKNPAVRWKPARLPNQPCNHWQSGDVELVIVYFRASLSFLPNHCNQAIMLGTYMIGGACSCEWKPVKDVACSLALFLQWFVQLLVFSDYLFFVCAWTCMYWIYISINIWKCFDLVGSEKKKNRAQCFGFTIQKEVFSFKQLVSKHHCWEIG